MLINVITPNILGVIFFYTENTHHICTYHLNSANIKYKCNILRYGKEN